MSELSDNLSPVKQALLALKQMQEKLATLENAKHEPIAVIGMGCRFPGAENPEAYWQLLQSGRDAITEVPPQHWDIREYYDANLNTPAKICTPYGGFVPNLQEFDAPFFRIAPREAISLDPQQRLLLEVSWEALENAGIATEEVMGSQTGVFIGICGTDYWHQLLSRKFSEIDAYLTTGNTHSLASGRLSYHFGFTGASISVDTACSSSLVALHLAIQSLRNQECSMALVGGVNRLVSPQASINLSKSSMLSADGRCKTFDDSANGFVRSEGCGVVVLKRLSDAIANKDRILALLKGSAVNQDGRTSGLTAPNSLSQQAVINQALSNAQVDPSQISYIETHGTGTSLGDLIEVEALSQVFSKSTPKQPLVLGAAKTNIGHSEGASGIAGLIKVILALEHGEIPQNLHLNLPNTQINWQELPFVLPSQPVSWNSQEQPRIAGVSAFGFSGTNAHVIVSESPKLESLQVKNLLPSHILTLSARTEKALRELVSNYADYLNTFTHLSHADICFTTNTGRSQFNYRLAIIADSTSDLQTKLTQFITGDTSSDIWQGRVETDRDRFTTKTVTYDLSNWQQTIYNLAIVYIKGEYIDWSEIYKNSNCHKISLPTYPFQRQTYWFKK
jgi:3-oxoacyl-[acyl-carrier-protein] synthase II